MVLATALACYGQKKNYNVNEDLHAALGCYDEKLHEDTASYYRNVSVFARTDRGTKIDVTEKYKKSTLESGVYIKQTPLNPSNIREYVNKKGGRITCSSNGNMYFIEYFEYNNPLEMAIRKLLDEHKRAKKSYEINIDSLQNEINRLKEERATIN